MKRIEKIYQYVKEQMKNLTPMILTNDTGVTTQEISERLSIQRTNASKDLNQLVRERRLKKLSGRPVKHVVQVAFQHRPLTKPARSYRGKSMDHSTKTFIEPLVEPVVMTSKAPGVEGIFKKVIDSAGSIKTPVEQAKAAILYPPKGLNCLITGPTGSGKTYFAHAMLQFVKLNQIVAKEKEFVVFNCADYAYNPELLISHLFGYVEGAFTDAAKAKEGIIDEADGSVLLLDEVHRLPPEGQEMIFYFMDHGVYAHLGETVKSHHTDVRVICATMESPTSSLLNTLVRRIPIVIQLPNFSDRPVREKIDLLKVMVSIETVRIRRRISLSEDVVKALIGSVSYGNVGQLKSNVQLVTARGFLNQMEQEELMITMDELTDNIKEGIMQLASDREVLSELSKYLEPQLVVSPNESLVAIQSGAYELPYNLYEIIGDKAALLKVDELGQELINNFITTDISVHLKSFYKDYGFTSDTENRLAETVDQRIIDVTKKIYNFAAKRLSYSFQPNFTYAMSLHISSFLRHIRLDKDPKHLLNENIRNMVLDYSTEFGVAKGTKNITESSYQMEIPESESYYLAVLLISLRENPEVDRIGTVVAAHGNSTASSMVQVVSQLLDVDNLKAVDMSSDMPPKEALYKIVEAVGGVNEKNGILLLVDMGSLSTLSKEIVRQTGIDVQTVDMVTTPIVFRAARKTALIDTQLETLHEFLKNFHGYTDIHQSETKQIIESWKTRAIIAICAPGEGTARQMKELIGEAVSPQIDWHLEVIPLSIVSMKEVLPKVQEDYEIVATTGIINPKIEVPYISMEDSFSDEAEKIIQQLLAERKEEVTNKPLDEAAAKETCLKYMEQSFTFINGKKIIDLLWSFIKNTQTQLAMPEEYASYINLIMHTSGMLERVLRNDTLTVSEKELGQLVQEPIYPVIVASIETMEKALDTDVPTEKIYFIAQLIKNAQCIENRITEIDTLD